MPNALLLIQAPGTHSATAYVITSATPPDDAGRNPAKHHAERKWSGTKRMQDICLVPARRSGPPEWWSVLLSKECFTYVFDQNLPSRALAFRFPSDCPFKTTMLMMVVVPGKPIKFGNIIHRPHYTILKYNIKKFGLSSKTLAKYDLPASQHPA